MTPDPGNNPNMNYGQYGRCEATAKSTGQRCGRPAVAEHGKCDMHGGGRNGNTPGAPSGPQNPAWKHGLNSQVLRDEDQAMLEAIESMGTAAKLEETLNLQLVKLYRAIDQLEQDERDEFLTKFWELAGKVEDPTRDELAQLARILGQNDRVIREYMDLIRKTAKDLHKIRDGETVRHEHDVDEDRIAEVRELVGAAYGDE